MSNKIPFLWSYGCCFTLVKIILPERMPNPQKWLNLSGSVLNQAHTLKKKKENHVALQSQCICRLVASSSVTTSAKTERFLSTDSLCKCNSIVYWGKKNCILLTFPFSPRSQILNWKPPDYTSPVFTQWRDVANNITHLVPCSSPPGTPLWRFDWQAEHPPVYLWVLLPGPRGCQGRCPDGRQACSAGCRGCLCRASLIWSSD